MIQFSRDPKIAEQQMRAIIFYLTAFGYIDGHFDGSEKEFIQGYIRQLVEFRAREASSGSTPSTDVINRITKHFHEVLDEVDEQIRATFDEPVAEGEDQLQFVLAKIKLRCFELFRGFTEENRAMLLKSVDELIMADGIVHENEARFRQELGQLLDSPIEIDDVEIEAIPEGSLLIDDIKKLAPKSLNHPLLQNIENEYADEREAFQKQLRNDQDLMKKTMDIISRQRARGVGKLRGVKNVSAFSGQEPFLDGHVYVLPPKQGKDYEIIVLGDLHGCYSCLKAALLQSDFFNKVQAYHQNPEKNPDVKLVFLGDYIDRGRYSYHGVLRTVMELFVHVPEHVFILRGNHEYYVEINGRVLGAVKPSEAITSLQGRASNDMFQSYMKLFECMPNMLLFDKTLFVHGGIPRDDTLQEKWVDFTTLNDPEIRFQMLWSDPSETDYIPVELQKANARFPFGIKQFKAFMSRLGCFSLIRGHERVIDGFKTVYDDQEGLLLSLFSCGGKNNDDLPLESNYRDVRPMALSIKHRNGINQVTPFEIDYEKFNDPKFNGFLQENLDNIEALEIDM